MRKGSTGRHGVSRRNRDRVVIMTGKLTTRLLFRQLSAVRPPYKSKANPAYLSSAVPNQRYDASLKLRQWS